MFQSEPFSLHFRTARTFSKAHQELTEQAACPGPRDRTALARGLLLFRQCQEVLSVKGICPVPRFPRSLVLAVDLEISGNELLFYLPR